MELSKVKSKKNGLEIGATRADENSPWVGYVSIDSGMVYFDNEQGRRMTDFHQQQAQEFAAALNSQ